MNLKQPAPSCTVQGSVSLSGYLCGTVATPYFLQVPSGQPQLASAKQQPCMLPGSRSRAACGAQLLGGALFRGLQKAPWGFLGDISKHILVTQLLFIVWQSLSCVTWGAGASPPSHGLVAGRGDITSLRAHLYKLCDPSLTPGKSVLFGTGL